MKKTLGSVGYVVGWRYPSTAKRAVAGWSHHRDSVVLGSLEDAEARREELKLDETGYYSWYKGTQFYIAWTYELERVG